MISFSVKADIAGLSRRLDDLARKQLPYATSLALNAVARQAVQAERQAMRSQLDRPSPFTLRGVTMLPARKESPTAWVYILPIQAHYLAPSVIGGPQVLVGQNRAVLAPKNVRLDAYGNVPRGLLAALKARPDIFIGPVTFADGHTVNGVWQLPPGERKGGRTGRGITGGRRKGWKLLIRFADPVELKARYRWGEATAQAVKIFPMELRAALTKALATAR
jgi:hypothetical protein